MLSDRALNDLVGSTLPSSSGWPRILGGIREAFEAELASYYAPTMTDTGWELGESHYVGVQAEDRAREHRDWVRTLPEDARSMGGYEPYAVGQSQQNRVLTLGSISKLVHFDRGVYLDVSARLKVLESDQIRVVLTEGARAIGWAGAFRQEPFTALEAKTFQGMVASLRAWALAARSAARHESASIHGLIEAVAGPAFIIDQKNRIAHVNQQGLELLGGRRQFVRDAIAAARARRPLSGGVVTYLDEACSGGYLLLVFTPSLADRACRARVPWEATPKDLRVLELVAEGKSNKEVAVALRCAEVTVEKRLSSLFRRAKVHSRTELLAKLATL